MLIYHIKVMSNEDPYGFVASGSLKIKGIGSGKIKK